MLFSKQNKLNSKIKGLAVMQCHQMRQLKLMKKIKMKKSQEIHCLIGLGLCNHQGNP